MDNTQKYHDDHKLRLGKHGVHRIEMLQSKVIIQCEKGVLWVTQTGDVVDHILYPGDQFTSRKRGRLLIEAMRDATMHIAASVKVLESRRGRLPLRRAA